jgi:hypothetical protein
MGSAHTLSLARLLLESEVAYLGSFPLFFHPVRLLNYALLVLMLKPLDRLLRLSGRYPRNYLQVALKSAAS